MGDQDETWGSRLAHPTMHTWTDGEPLRLPQRMVATDDPDPKALACDGLLLRQPTASEPPGEALWLRFVDGRPVSAITLQFLAWCAERGAASGMTTLVVIWDNASWHVSKAVRAWLRAHNQRVHREGGVRLVPCFLPRKRPWLNPSEPHWVHGTRRIVEPARLLTARELEERVCATFGCPRCDHLTIPQEVV